MAFDCYNQELFFDTVHTEELSLSSLNLIHVHTQNWQQK